MKHKETTHQIIGCAMEVHTTLGNGFQESVYQKCLEIELNKTELSFTREFTMPIIYDGVQVGTRRVDFLIENEIMVELKAVIELEDVHLNQSKNYLEAYNVETGLLINFGAKSLQFKRLFNNHRRDQD